MSNTAPRSTRRHRRTAAIGAVVVTAAVALPAFAMERGGDDVVPVANVTSEADQAAARSVAAQREAVTDPYAEAAQAVAQQQAFVASFNAATPEDQFAIRWLGMSDLERYVTGAYFGAVEQAAAEQAAAEKAAAERAAAAEAARQQQAARAAQQRESSRTASPSSSPSGGGGGGNVSGGVWDTIAQCESGGNWSINSGNGFSGGLQFHPGTWRAMGGTAYAPTAAQATKAQQIEIAERTLAAQGWGAWPACSRKAGLR